MFSIDLCCLSAFVTVVSLIAYEVDETCTLPGQQPLLVLVDFFVRIFIIKFVSSSCSRLHLH